MTDQQTCPAMRQDGEACGKPARLWKYDDGTKELCCICHSKDPTKDKVEFQKALDEVFADENSDCYDLSWFVFPEGNWVFPQKITKDIYFLHAVFEGEIWFNLKTRPRRTFVKLADFSYSVFKSDAWFTNCHFEGEVRFCHGTKFVGQVMFAMCNFREYANFIGCVFEVPPPSGLQNVDFRMCEFDKSASFRGAKFKRPVCFSNVTFKSDAIFSFAEFSDLADFSTPISVDDGESHPTLFKGMTRFVRTQFSEANFSRCQFESGALFRELKSTPLIDFRFCPFSIPEQIRFEKSDISRVRWAGSDISKVIFQNVKWHTGGSRLLRSMRNMIADEVELRARAKTKVKIHPDQDKRKKVKIDPDQYEVTAQTYRQLQQNYGESYRYFEAGDFYIGQVEMQRRIWRVTNLPLAVAGLLYKISSNYCEEFVLPMIWMLLILSISVTTLLLSGFYASTYDMAEPELRYVEYDFGLPSLALISDKQFWDDCLEAVCVNIDLLLFRAGAAGKHLRSPYQKAVMKIESLIIAILLTFLILALRRKFKRKSF